MQIVLSSSLNPFIMSGSSEGIDWKFELRGISGLFLPGDTFTLNTQREQRSAVITRGVATNNVTALLQQGSVWPKLYSGKNVLNTNAAFTWIYLRYFPKYLGV